MHKWCALPELDALRAVLPKTRQSDPDQAIIDADKEGIRQGNTNMNKELLRTCHSFFRMVQARKIMEAYTDEKAGVPFAPVLLVSSVALADFDLSGMSNDELIELHNSINLAMRNSSEWQEVTVPQGLWQIGVDIPAGHWQITACENVGYTYVLYSDIHALHRQTSLQFQITKSQNHHTRLKSKEETSCAAMIVK